MLVGSYPMSVDSKARVTLPATFRKEMVSDDSKTIYLVPMKDSVNGFTPAGFEAWVNSLFEGEGEGFNARSRRDVARTPRRAPSRSTSTRRAAWRSASSTRASPALVRSTA